MFYLYWSFSVVADILCEFLEVAIHLILYVREIYPSGIFQKRKKYNVPVQVMFLRLMAVRMSTALLIHRAMGNRRKMLLNVFDHFYFI